MLGSEEGERKSGRAPAQRRCGRPSLPEQRLTLRSRFLDPALASAAAKRTRSRPRELKGTGESRERLAAAGAV